MSESAKETRQRFIEEILAWADKKMPYGRENALIGDIVTHLRELQGRDSAPLCEHQLEFPRQLGASEHFVSTCTKCGETFPVDSVQSAEPAPPDQTRESVLTEQGQDDLELFQSANEWLNHNLNAGQRAAYYAGWDARAKSLMRHCRSAK